MTSPIPFLGAFGGGQSPSFNAPLITTLVPNSSGGDSTPTFTRATTAYVTDFEGLLKPVPSGCARFSGARFVRNDFLASNDLTSAAWVLTGGATKAAGSVTFSASAADIVSQVTYNFSAGTGTANKTVCVSMTVAVASGTGQFRINNTHSAVAVYVSPDLTATTTPQRFSFTKTFGAGVGNGEVNAGIQNGTGAAAATFLVSNLQVEDVTGQTITAPSEYVSNGVLSAPYHGAGVDGVKFFDTENGNTVVSNVVTEATGAAIADATLDGYLAEGSRQNRCLHSQDFSNAAWVSGGGGIAVTPNTAIAPDGTLTADTLTASGANGTLIQDLGVVASAAKAGGLYLKRKTGTGNIDLTLDGGATWTTVAVTSSWLLLEKTQTLADEDFGIRIVTSGDEVYSWQGQVETVASSTAKLSSVIPTTSAAVTRNFDALSFSSTGNLNEYGITSYFEFKRPVGWGGTSDPTASVLSFGNYNANASMYMGGYGGVFNSIVANFGTTWSLTGTFGTAHNPLGSRNKTAISFDAAGENATASTNGSAASTLTASPVKSSNWNAQIIAIGNVDTTSYSIDQSVNIRNVKIWKTAKTAAQLEALTT